MYSDFITVMFTEFRGKNVFFTLFYVYRLQVITKESLLTSQVNFNFFSFSSYFKVSFFGYIRFYIDNGYWQIPCLLVQREDLQRVMDLLSLKEHHVRTLLIHYCWDVDKVIAVLVEDGKDKLFAAAGVQLLDDHLALSSSSSTFTCDICYEDVSSDLLTVMDCGHYFCNECEFTSIYQMLCLLCNLWVLISSCA